MTWRASSPGERWSTTPRATSLASVPPSDLDARRAVDLAPLAAEPPSVNGLLELLAAPNCRSRRPVWRRYDHMNGTNTLAGPGEADAALLRVKGTQRALAIALDGPGRLAALDPRLAAASAVLESALNVACSGATPIGATNCLNLGSPETESGYWALSETVAGLGDACRLLGVPIVSGNVSLYNETADGPIVPAALVGMVGLLEDRSVAVTMRWSDGDKIYLLGEPAWEPSSLAGSEHAWRRGERGGRPNLDADAAAGLVRLLPALAADRIISGAHDVSIGGLGVALARMAIASGCGATVQLPDEAAVLPAAALYGEAAGRALVSVAGRDAARLEADCAVAGVRALRLGEARSGDLSIAIGPGTPLRVEVRRLEEAWETAF